MKIFLILIFSQAIFCSKYLLSSYEVLDINSEKSHFLYILQDNTIKNDLYPYLFFKSSGKANISIREGKNIIKSFELTDYYLFPTNEYKDSELEIDVNVTDRIKLIFIDNSKELKIGLEDFLGWNYNFEKMEAEPLPLIFNLDTIQETTTIFLQKEDEGKLYETLFSLEFCINDGIKCDFTKIENKLTLDKEKNYKIKIKPLGPIENNFSFEPITIFNVIKEVEFGPILFDTHKNIEEQIFIVNVSNYEKVNFFIMHNDNVTYIKSFTEEEKQLLINNDYLEHESFSSIETNKNISFVTDNRPYITILINYKEEEYNDGSINFYNGPFEIRLNQTLEFKKGNSSLLEIIGSYHRAYLLSSAKCIIYCDKFLSGIYPRYQENVYLFVDNQTETYKYIYINAAKEDCKIKFFTFEDKDAKYLSEDIVIIPDNDYHQFYRINTLLRFRHEYYFGNENKYYYYNKKYYGNIDFYIYNKELNFDTDITKIFDTIDYESNDYQLINNKLITLTGYQLISFYNSYGGLYDSVFQIVDDSDIIECSNLFNFENDIYNIFRILNENKIYYIDFDVDHLIKLDENFSNAEVKFIDDNNNEYILNSSKGIIELKGKNVKVKSNQTALIYFYQRIENFDREYYLIGKYITTIEFGKNQTGKIMKLKIENHAEYNPESEIIIMKDFGFLGYYPMSVYYNHDRIKGPKSFVNIYIDNLYDKLECNLHKDEKYLIYISGINLTDSKISDNIGIEYVDNLATPKNKFNFEVIKGNSNGLLILDNLGIGYVNYQFFMCKNKNITYKIEDTSKAFKEDTIYVDDKFSFDLTGYENLAHSFKSENEFLLVHSFTNRKPEIKNYYEMVIKGISPISDNKIQIFFNSPFNDNSLNKYYIIIAKKDDKNSIENFGDPCYLANLMITNSDKIILRTINHFSYNIDDIDYYDYYSNRNNYYISADIDISKLNVNENEELVANVICSDITNGEFLYFSNPIEFKVKINKKEAVEFNIGDIVKYNLDDTYYFKFAAKPSTLFLSFINGHSYVDFIILTSPDSKKHFYDTYDDPLKIDLTEDGVYYLEFCTNSNYHENLEDPKFTTLYEGQMIENIDLTKRIYSSNIELEYRGKKPKPNYYKVENLKEDKYVIFRYNSHYRFYDNLFEIVNENLGNRTTNINSFLFLKNYNYTIYVYFIGDDYRFEYIPYEFFPIFEDTVEEIKEEKNYISQIPKIYHFKFKDLTYICFEEFQKGYYAELNDNFAIDKIEGLYFEEDDIFEYDNKDKTGIIITLPTIVYPQTKIIFTHNIIESIKGETILVPANENMLIQLIDKEENETNFNQLIKSIDDENEPDDEKEPDEDEKDPEEDEKDPDDEDDEKKSNSILISFFNVLTTYLSPAKNMKLTYSNETDLWHDFIIQNYYPLPIYVKANKKDLNITVKKYRSKYAIAAVLDSYLLKTYLNMLNKSIIDEDGSYIDYYNKLFPMNIRLNSDISVFYELINIFLNNIDFKLNVYIKKIYGETELYECKGNSNDLKDLTFLTKPISKCEDKKSIFNRIFSFDGTKILTGYLGPNSYFDIYVEIDDGSNVIKMNTFSKLLFENTAKYLIKGKEYILDFTADHLIKLDPGSNAEVIISKDNKDIQTLNSKNPTYILKGNNYKIISKNDNAMIFFYSKLKPSYKQIKIENNGHNFRFKVNENVDLLYALDFGFENYNPINIEFVINDYYFDDNKYIYLENIYNKLQTKLIDGEYLFLYYLINYNDDDNNDYKLQIEYLEENINTQNNEYSFHLIKKDTKDSSLIINSGKSQNFPGILYQVNFCKSPHDIKMTIESTNGNETIIEFDKDNTSFNQTLDKYSTKLTFNSKEDFIFSYSYVDYMDLFYNITGVDEWEELTDLSITEIIDRSKEDNILKIKFKPNYKNCSTKYIIVIASKDENNNKENLENHCYVIKLVNEKPKGVKISNYFDIGEKNLIEAEVDISDIINPKNEYVVSIISQELRAEKKINFYEPKEFYHKENKKDKSNGKTILIIVLSAIGFLIIVFALFLIIRYLRKRKGEDFERISKEITSETKDGEKLLQEM